MIIVIEKTKKVENTAETTANFAEIIPIVYIEKCAERMISKAQDKEVWLNDFWNVIAQKTAFSACRRVESSSPV